MQSLTLIQDDDEHSKITRDVLVTGPAIKPRLARLALLFWALSMAGVCLSMREADTSGSIWFSASAAQKL